MIPCRQVLIGLLTLVVVGGCTSVSPLGGTVESISDTNTSKSGRPLPFLNADSTLDDYLVYAAFNNAGLEVAFNRWRATLERIPQVRSLPDPRFSYAYFIENVETMVGPQRHKFELSQSFPWFGKLRLKGDMATADAEAAYERYEAAKLKLFYRVKKSYYEYYYLARAIVITEQNMKLLSELEAVARTKYKAGTAKHSSVIKAQVELGRLENRLRTLKDFRKPLAAKLNAALNRAPNTEISWPDTIQNQRVSISEDEFLSALRTSNPELKALGHTVKKESSRVRLAHKSYYPDIMLGAGLIETGDASMPNVDDSGKDPIVAMIGVSLPIWQGKYRAEVREAEARERAAQKLLQDRENSLLADVQLAFYHLRDAERKISLYENGLIPKARQSLQVNRQAFESGKTDFLDVIDAERVLLEFELSYERALTDRDQRLAELEMLVGKELSRKPAKGGK